MTAPPPARRPRLQRAGSGPVHGSPGGDRLGRAARRAVDATQHDDFELGAGRRLDQDVRGDRRVAKLCRLVVAEQPDAVRRGHLAPAQHLADRAHLEAGVDQRTWRRRHRLEPRRRVAHDAHDVRADGAARRAVL
eukprot:2587855-Prymnesium_polylepis.1